MFRTAGIWLLFSGWLLAVPETLNAQLTTDRRHPYRAGAAFSYNSEEQPAYTLCAEAPLGKAFSVLAEAGGFYRRNLSFWRPNPASSPSLYEGRGVAHVQARYFPMYKRVGTQKAFLGLYTGFERNHLSYVLSTQPQLLENNFQLGFSPGLVQPLGNIFYVEFQGLAGLGLVRQRIYDDPWAVTPDTESTLARFEVGVRVGLGMNIFDRKK